MAITDNETAKDVNTLLLWLLPSLRTHHCKGPRELPRADAMAAAERLAAQAHRKLVGGVHRHNVRDAIELDSWRFGAIDNGEGF